MTIPRNITVLEEKTRTPSVNRIAGDKDEAGIEGNIWNWIICAAYNVKIMEAMERRRTIYVIFGFDQSKT